LSDFLRLGYLIGEMQLKSDAQLLREYAESGSESAFTELVTRHTDLVYSAALRQVPSSDLACDVAQNVFTSLARGSRTLAGKLNPDASLAGWLCRCTRNLALNLRRDDFRRHSRERQAMENLDPSPVPAPDWGRLCPILDEAISGLNDTDHDALVLRFFKNQDLRSVGLALGVSDDTAQKRVSRALDKLREYLARHGITTTEAALAMALSANAVQAAPAGLAVTISTAALLAGTAIATTAITTTTTAIAMTTLQKTIIGVTLAAAIGTGIYEARQASILRSQNQLLRQEQAPLTAQIQQLQRERDDATNRLVLLADENTALKRNPPELLKLRGEVGRLRQESASAATNSALNRLTANPETRKLLRDQQKLGMTTIYKDFARRLNLTSEQEDKLNDVLADNVMDNIDRITEVLRDGKTREQMNQLFAAQDAALLEKVQALIGPDGISQYQDYTRNLGSSLTTQQFKRLLTGDDAAKEGKSKQLYQVMQEETQLALSSAGLPPDYQTVPMLNFRNIASEEQAEQSIKLLGGIYDRVAARGSAFLTPEDLEKFQDFKTSAITNSRMALTMNRTMMAPISK
jgi:RNA polymerase sigma factor (sigma-70 family)